MMQINVTLLIVISQKVVPDLNVFGLGVQDWVLGYTNGTHAITVKRHSGVGKPIVSQSGGHPKQLGIASGSSYILSLYGGLCYT